MRAYWLARHAHTRPSDASRAAWFFSMGHIAASISPRAEGRARSRRLINSQWYWRADFVSELSDAAIARHGEFGPKLPTWKSTMHLYPIDGVASEPSDSDTAWAYRSSKWAEVIVGVDPDPANAELIKNWTVDYWEALHPYSAGGAYVNFMMDEGQDRVQATYRGNYERLAEIKRKYDPTNFFHVNQNVRPAS
jgi:hypothetical protein